LILLSIRTRLLLFALSALCSSTSLAAAGFFPLDQLAQSQTKAYRALTNCGAVRIHDSEPIFLTALHCLSGEMKIKDFKQLGRSHNPSNLYYLETEPQTLQSGIEVLRSGGCFTDYALDVLSKLSDASDIDASTQCLTGDWIIFRDNRSPSDLPKACAPIAERFEFGEAIWALGQPMSRVHRPAGLQNLDGRVFSTGALLGADFNTQATYPFLQFWTPVMASSFSEYVSTKKLLVTNADSIPGMSGGPIVNSEGFLVGTTTLGLVPNFGADELAHFNDASHVGIPVQEMIRQHPSIQNYFKCDR
jgi:hypothetical protein